MKKKIAIVISTMMICMMVGCNIDHAVKDKEVNAPVPTSTVAPTKKPDSTKEKPDESKAKDKLKVMPGFEAWDKTDAVIALNQVLAMKAPVSEVDSKEGNTGTDDKKGNTGTDDKKNNTGDKKSETSTGDKKSETSSGDKKSETSTGDKKSETSTEDKKSESSTEDKKSNTTTEDKKNGNTTSEDKEEGNTATDDKKEGNTASEGFRQYRLNEINQFMGISFDQKLTPNQYTIVDLDNDTTPEVIVTLSKGEDNWLLVLRYYEGSIYGYPFEFRELQMPKTDGTFLASSGVADNQIMKLSFEGLEQKENRLAYSKSKKKSVKYYIADKKVKKAEFNYFYNEYFNKEDVKPYLFSSELRAGYTGVKLLRVDFEAITKPVGKELESYSSEQEEEAMFTHSSKIPQALSDLVTNAMEAGTEEETFAPLTVGEEISQEEFCKETGFVVEGMGSVTPVRVDVDNDSIQELFGLCYWGGTGGFSSIELYRHTTDGKYTLSSRAECMYQDYQFISYQGKNYLLMKDFDYYTKYYSGYTLYLYENGVLADGMTFEFEIKDYNMKTAVENATFRGIDQAMNTLSNRKLPEKLAQNDGVIDGSAETFDETGSAEYRYFCDINNDGVVEHYNKSMWYPSNLGTVMECTYDFKDSKILEDLCARLADEMGEGRLYTFWIDKIGDTNVLYLYYGNNLNYTLYAYWLK